MDLCNLTESSLWGNNCRLILWARGQVDAWNGDAKQTNCLHWNGKHQVYVQGDMRAVLCTRQLVINGWKIKSGLAWEAALGVNIRFGLYACCFTFWRFLQGVIFFFFFFGILRCQKLKCINSLAFCWKSLFQSMRTSLYWYYVQQSVWEV